MRDPSRIVEIPYADWSPRVNPDEARRLAGELELGKVLYLPRLAFVVAAGEARFYDTRWLSGTHKSASYEPGRAARSSADLRGVRGAPEDLRALAGMIGRFRGQALSVIEGLFPQYRPRLRIAPTTFRPGDVEHHKLSWRRDDTLLHVDAFPSRPNRGERILRVFTNVSPGGTPRVWKIGDLFEQTAREFAPRVRRAMPGIGALLSLLRVTKSRRSAYDHLMLRMHDAMKRDAAYQRRASHLVFGFPAGSTWICFSDQTAHAALSGQFMLEQTLHVAVDALYFPERSPLRVLERLTSRSLA